MNLHNFEILCRDVTVLINTELFERTRQLCDLIGHPIGWSIRHVYSLFYVRLCKNWR